MEPELVQISCGYKHTKDIPGGSKVTISPETMLEHEVVSHPNGENLKEISCLNLFHQCLKILLTILIYNSSAVVYDRSIIYILTLGCFLL